MALGKICGGEEWRWRKFAEVESGAGGRFVGTQSGAEEGLQRRRVAQDAGRVPGDERVPEG